MPAHRDPSPSNPAEGGQGALLPNSLTRLATSTSEFNDYLTGLGHRVRLPGSSERLETDSAVLLMAAVADSLRAAAASQRRPVQLGAVAFVSETEGREYLCRSGTHGEGEFEVTPRAKTARAPAASPSTVDWTERQRTLLEHQEDTAATRDRDEHAVADAEWNTADLSALRADPLLPSEALDLLAEGSGIGSRVGLLFSFAQSSRGVLFLTTTAESGRLLEPSDDAWVMATLRLLTAAFDRTQLAHYVQSYRDLLTHDALLNEQSAVLGGEFDGSIERFKDFLQFLCSRLSDSLPFDRACFLPIDRHSCVLLQRPPDPGGSWEAHVVPRAYSTDTGNELRTRAGRVLDEALAAAESSSAERARKRVTRQDTRRITALAIRVLSRPSVTEQELEELERNVLELASTGSEVGTSGSGLYACFEPFIEPGYELLGAAVAGIAPTGENPRIADELRAFAGGEILAAVSLFDELPLGFLLFHGGGERVFNADDSRDMKAVCRVLFQTYQMGVREGVIRKYQELVGTTAIDQDSAEESGPDVDPFLGPFRFLASSLIGSLRDVHAAVFIPLDRNRFYAELSSDSGDVEPFALDSNLDLAQSILQRVDEAPLAAHSTSGEKTRSFMRNTYAHRIAMLARRATSDEDDSDFDLEGLMERARSLGHELDPAGPATSADLSVLLGCVSPCVKLDAEYPGLPELLRHLEGRERPPAGSALALMCLFENVPVGIVVLLSDMILRLTDLELKDVKVVTALFLKQYQLGRRNEIIDAYRLTADFLNVDGQQADTEQLSSTLQPEIVDDLGGFVPHLAYFARQVFRSYPTDPPDAIACTLLANGAGVVFSSDRGSDSGLHVARFRRPAAEECRAWRAKALEPQHATTDSAEKDTTITASFRVARIDAAPHADFQHLNSITGLSLNRTESVGSALTVFIDEPDLPECLLVIYSATPWRFTEEDASDIRYLARLVIGNVVTARLRKRSIEIAKSEAAEGMLLATTHRLKNAIHQASMFLELLRGKSTEDMVDIVAEPEVPGLLGKACDSLETVHRVFHSTRAMFTAQRDELRTHRTIADVAATLRHSVASTPGSSRVEVTYFVQREAWGAEGLPHEAHSLLHGCKILVSTRLDEVLRIFVENAIRAANLQDESHLRYVKAHLDIDVNAAVLAVRIENGGAIPQHALEYIRRGDPIPRARQGSQGTGVGIYLARRFLRETNDGTLDIDSDPTEKHTSVEISIPIRDKSGPTVVTLEGIHEVVRDETRKDGAHLEVGTRMPEGSPPLVMPDAWEPLLRLVVRFMGAASRVEAAEEDEADDTPEAARIEPTLGFDVATGTGGATTILRFSGKFAPLPLHCVDLGQYGPTLENDSLPEFRESCGGTDSYSGDGELTTLALEVCTESEGRNRGIIQ